MTATVITETERTFWWERLSARADRLKRLVDLRAPAVVINMELGLVAKAVAGLDPDAYGAELSGKAQAEARRCCALCTSCGTPVTYGAEWCAACEQEIAADAALGDVIG